MNLSKMSAIKQDMGMLKKILVALLIPIVMLTGCNVSEEKSEHKMEKKVETTQHSDEKTIEDNVEQKTEQQSEIQAEEAVKKTNKQKKNNKFSENQNFFTYKFGAYSEDGFYTYDENTECIYFIDKNTHNAHVLCSNIGCTHSDDGCSAFFREYYGIYYTGDYLYVLASDNSVSYTCLYRFNPDGSEKKEVGKLFSYEEEDLGWATVFIIHKGYGYMSINWLDTEAEKEREQVLYKVSLEDGSKEEIYKMSGYCPQIGIANTDGDNIYFYTDSYKDGNPEELENNYYVYNISDGSVTPLEIKGDMIFEAAYGADIYVLNNERKRSKDLGYYEVKFEIHNMDKNGESRECIYSMPQEELDKKIGIVFIGMDEKYIYLFGSTGTEINYVKIISLDGKESYTYEDSSLHQYLWSDGTSLLIQDMKTRDYILRDIKTGKDTVIKQ